MKMTAPSLQGVQTWVEHESVIVINFKKKSADQAEQEVETWVEYEPTLNVRIPKKASVPDELDVDREGMGKTRCRAHGEDE